MNVSLTPGAVFTVAAIIFFCLAAAAVTFAALTVLQVACIGLACYAAGRLFP